MEHQDRKFPAFIDILNWYIFAVFCTASGKMVEACPVPARKPVSMGIAWELESKIRCGNRDISSRSNHISQTPELQFADKGVTKEYIPPEKSGGSVEAPRADGFRPSGRQHSA